MVAQKGNSTLDQTFKCLSTDFSDKCKIFSITVIISRKNEIISNNLQYDIQ